MKNVFKEIKCVFIFDKNWTSFCFMLNFRSVFARLPLEFHSTMLEIEQTIMLEKWFMLARFRARRRSKFFPLELGSKIISCDIARARLGLKIFSLGSLELEKFTLVPNTILVSRSIQFHDYNKSFDVAIRSMHLDRIEFWVEIIDHHLQMRVLKFYKCCWRKNRFGECKLEIVASCFS